MGINYEALSNADISYKFNLVNCVETLFTNDGDLWIITPEDEICLNIDSLTEFVRKIELFRDDKNGIVKCAEHIKKCVEFMKTKEIKPVNGYYVINDKGVDDGSR